MIATAFQPTSLGMELDTSPEAFGMLRESSDIANDVEALRARMEEDGYLYLPGYLDRDEVLEARREILSRLAKSGHIDLSRPLMEGWTTPETHMAMDDGAAIDNEPLSRVLYSGAMMQFYTRFLGEEVRHFDYTWLRAVTRGHGTPPHLDIVYMGRGTQNLWTAWTPLGDIPLPMGGVMILEKSHRHDRINSNYGRRDVDTYCSNRPGSQDRFTGQLSRNPVKLRQNLGGRWLTAPEYRAGDLLTFSMFTIHASLDNHSDCIRLSSDSRYQPASEPADERWIGEKPIAHGSKAKRGLIC